jgi:hypothetical protein
MTHPFVPLRDDEQQLEDQQEILWRQIHPGFLHDGEVSSQAFRPTPKDDGKVSMRRQAFGAGRAYVDHQRLGFRTAGTWGVSVGEVMHTQARAVDDASAPGRPEAHAYIDYRHLNRRQTEATAKLLKVAAIARGRAYP